MHKGRLEAFSDGVIAIIITIMVLELKVPHGGAVSDLIAMSHHFLFYLLSFIYVGIYWNNHHHLLQSAEQISGGALWANSHLLFWLSLVPFATGWMGEHWAEPIPVVAYGVVLLGCALSFTILVKVLVHGHEKDSLLVKAVGKDTKGHISLVIYIASIPLAFLNTFFSFGCFAAVALIWLIPDRRIESKIEADVAK